MKLQTLIDKLFVVSSSNTLLQLFRYTFVGGLAFLVDIGLLWGLTEFGGLHYLFSAIISFIAGLTVNYFLSTWWIFRSGAKFNNKHLEFILFAVIGVIGLGLNELFIWFFSSVLGIWYILSKILTTMITYLWNFFARKYLLFNKKEH